VNPLLYDATDVQCRPTLDKVFSVSVLFYTPWPFSTFVLNYPRTQTHQCFINVLLPRPTILNPQLSTYHDPWTKVADLYSGTTHSSSTSASTQGRPRSDCRCIYSLHPYLQQFREHTMLLILFITFARSTCPTIQARLNPTARLPHSYSRSSHQHHLS